MKKLLTFRRRASFFLKHKVWLQENNYDTFSRYGISLCTDNGGAKWIAYENVEDDEAKKDGGIEIVKLSRLQYNTCEKEAIGFYVFGTEGIFFKANNTDGLKRIFYKDGITGMYICPKINIVFIFMADGNDIIGRLCAGEYFNVETLKASKVKICNIDEKPLIENSMFVNRCEDLHLCALVEGRYFYMHAAYDEVYIQEDVYFETTDDYKELIANRLVIAHSNKDENKKMLVNLSNNRVIPRRQAVYIEKIKDGYYFISDDNIQKYILAYDINKNCGEMPAYIEDAKEWSILTEILGMTFLKVKHLDGITIVAIGNDTVVTKKYPRAVDIKFSNPLGLSNGNLLEIKPIAVYEEEVTE